MDHVQKIIPRLLYDSVLLNRYSNATQLFSRSPLDAHHFNQLNSISLSFQQRDVIVQLQYSKKLPESEKSQSEFLAQKFSGDLGKVMFSKTGFLNKTIEEKLTFYDGTDFNAAADKDYSKLDTFYLNNTCYTVLERKDKNFYKELVVWELDLLSGEVVNQYLIPRKILASEAFSRYGKIGEASIQVLQNKLIVYLLESKTNAKEEPHAFNFNRFQQESKIKNCNLVLYQLKTGGLVEKKILHDNSYFEFIPIKYISDKNEQPLLYFNNGTQEKFATLNLNL